MHAMVFSSILGLNKLVDTSNGAGEKCLQMLQISPGIQSNPSREQNNGIYKSL